MVVYDTKYGELLQPNNPTNSQRHMLERAALLQAGRPEDFEYIRKLTKPPQDITAIVSPGSLRSIRIGIIGAGLAGLASAFELRKTGASITLFEAEEHRIGGRVYTYHFDRSGQLYGEFGAMRIPVSHETVWHYINLLNLPTRPFIQNNANAFIYLKLTRVRNDAGGKSVMKHIYPKYALNEWERNTPWQQLAYYGFESPLLPAAPEERSELLQVKPVYNAYNAYWDSRSIRSLLESLRLSQGAINLISSLSPLAGQNLYNSYIDIAQAVYPANLSYLYEIPGGMSRLPNALYNALINPNPQKFYPNIPAQLIGEVTVKKGNWIVGIHRDASGKVILEFRNRQVTQPLFETFDYVVLAIPFSTLRSIDINPLFSGIKMQAIREVSYIAAQKTLILCSKRFWEEGGANERIIGGGSYTDLPVTTLWYPSDHSGRFDRNGTFFICSNPDGISCEPPARKTPLSQMPGVMIASYGYSLDSIRLMGMAPKLRADEIKRQVEEVHGLPKGYLDRIVLDIKSVDWNTAPWERGALPFYTPQQKSLFSYGMALPEYDSRVFMAGDHISAVHRWMQGALQSGMIAANQLASAFRQHASGQ